MFETKSFPSINQFHSAIHNVKHRACYNGVDVDGTPVYDLSRTLPTINYRGTVKLHGTNAGIVYDCDSQSFFYQSRERVLSLQQDNAGIMLYMSNQTDVLTKIIEQYKEHYKAADHLSQIALFGEWCGQGIQRGVAISGLPKMFVIFAVKFYYGVDDTGQQWAPSWVPLLPQVHDEAARIFCIEQFPVYEISIDFNRPEHARNKIVTITEQVEAQCPVGAHFGVTGVGEGVVWKADMPGWYSSVYWFKVKGEKHSISKVKTMAPVDVEAVATIREFVERTVTEQRLLQGVHWLQTEAQKPLALPSMGDFIRWIINDVVKEETETLVASQIEPKKINKPASDKCRVWFMNYLNKMDPLT